MPVEIIGMVGTRDASEIKGPLVDGPVVDWMDGPVIDPEYLVAISQAHDDGDFDRVLVGYGAVAPEGWAVASAVLNSTRKLKVLVAQRPGFIQPVVLARMAATLDHLTGGGRIAIHFITGGDEADQRREGDFVPHDTRYRRTKEMMMIARRLWREDAPFDFEGEFYRYESAFSSVKPVSPGGIPFYFAGASPPAIEVGAAEADVYAFWGEPRDQVAARMETINRAADKVGRTLRFSLSLRPIIADTEEEAWEKAEWIAEETAARIELAKQRMAGHQDTYQGLGGQRNATFSVDRETSGTTSVGRKRLIQMSADQDVYDERLWMKVANLTGAAGNSTALVGTPEQVAEAMLRYYDLGITTLLLKGFDPLADAIDFGKRLIPLVRDGAAARDELAVR
ncbi:MAG TPA: LLM class flavin-dependent oxidoreductase [Acidimicrobiales bacterium]|jgi:alkanesulfonate monooxygenase|nr:LLM class flavin-dependent oxidoreductase [Acidimicrobiales bacterium]